MRLTLEERFWSKVDRSGPCWEWTRFKDWYGYPRLRVRGKSITATRLAYVLQKGRFNPKLCVLHKCDNPGCVRGSHLFLGTQVDNIKDMVGKRRHAGQNWRASSFRRGSE